MNEAVIVGQNQLQSEHVADFKVRCFHCWVIIGWRRNCFVKRA